MDSLELIKNYGILLGGLIIAFTLLIRLLSRASVRKYGNLVLTRFERIKFRKRRNVIIRKPQLIMGDRGYKKNGFDDKLYFRRDIDDSISNYLKKDESQMIVITGHFSSGKSRAIYEYIKSDKCHFKDVYLLNINDSEVKIEKIIQEINRLNPQKTLIIIDEVLKFLHDAKIDDNRTNQLFGYLSNKGFKVIVTFSIGEVGYNNFINKCKVGCDDFRGNNSMSDIRIIHIPKIEYGDECHDWARANLRNNNGFSTVIGGYIPNLYRSIEKIRYFFSDNKHPVELKLLVTFYVSSKFRHKEGRREYFLKKMYNAKFDKIDDNTFKQGLYSLVLMGFLEEEEVVCQYKISDTQAYQAFFMHCAIGEFDNGANSISSLINNTIESEEIQVDWLIELDSSNAIYYHRAACNSFFPRTKEYVKTKIENYLTTNNFEINQIPEDFISFPISYLVEFYGEEGYLYIKDLIDNKGLKPTIYITCALIRLSNRTNISSEIVEYAKSLVNRFSLTQNIYYYRCIEQIDASYNIVRAKTVIDIFKGNTSHDYIKKDYKNYCSDLLCKAVTGKMYSVFWKKFSNIELLITKDTINHFIKNVCNNASHRMADQLFVDFFYRSLKPTNWEWNVSKPDIAYKMIEACHTFIAAKRIYDTAIDQINISQYNNFCRDEDGFKNKLMMPLLNKKELNEKEIGVAREMIMKRFELSKDQNQNAEWFETRRKLLNKYLGCMKAFQVFYDELKNIPDYKQFIDDVTVSTAMGVVCNQVIKNPEYDDFENDIKTIYEWKSTLKRCDPSYYTNICKLVSKLIERNYHDGRINEIMRYADLNLDLYNDNKICRAAKIRCILSADDVIREIEKQKREIKNINNINNIIKNNVYYTDYLANLLMVVTNSRFINNEKILTETNNLIDLYEKKIQIPRHDYYRQLLIFNIIILKKNRNNYDSEHIINLINELNKKLSSVNSPLIENDVSLYDVAVGCDHLEINTALDLLSEINKSKIFPQLWRGKLLDSFIDKLSKVCIGLEPRKVREIMDKIQNMVNNHIQTDYSSIISNVIKNVNTINKKLNIKNHPIAINFPLISTQPAIRHMAWDYYISTQNISAIGDKTLKTFIDREQYHFNQFPNERHLYLERAKKELNRRNKNRMRQRLHKHRIPHIGETVAPIQPMGR